MTYRCAAVLFLCIQPRFQGWNGQAIGGAKQAAIALHIHIAVLGLLAPQVHYPAVCTKISGHQHAHHRHFGSGEHITLQSQIQEVAKQKIHGDLPTEMALSHLSLIHI